MTQQASATPRPEFTRPIDVRQTEGQQQHLVASKAECAALAKRFGLVRIDRLEADLDLHRSDREVEARGRLRADFVQSCAVSAEDLPVSVDEEILFRFVPATSGHAPDEEIELDADACDEIEYEGSHIDLGEAVAQSVALAIDPYRTGPNADTVRKAVGLGTPEDSGPFAALKGLTQRD